MKSTNCKLEHKRARSILPLQVVDDHQHRFMCCHGFLENGLAHSGRSRQHEGAAVGRRLIDEGTKEFEVLVTTEQYRRDLMG
jgi:hypothetical protein